MKYFERSVCGVFVLGVLVACGGAPSKKVNPSSIGSAATSADTSQYIYGSGTGAGSAQSSQDTLTAKAREAAALEISSYLWSQVESETVVVTTEGTAEVSEVGQQKVRTRTRLKASMNALIQSVPGSRQCTPGQCTIRLRLKRADARAEYDRALKVEQASFRQHAKAAMGRGPDIFAFAGDYASASLAYTFADELLKRRFRVDPSVGNAHAPQDQTLWETLTQERARRLAGLRLTVLPLATLDYQSSVQLTEVPLDAGGKLADPAFAEAIRQNLAQAVRGLRLKTEVSAGCTSGLRLQPSARMSCEVKSGYHFCTLTMGGQIGFCSGEGRVADFSVDDGSMRGASSGNDYAKLKTEILKKLSQPSVSKTLKTKLKAHLPVH